MSDAPAPRVVVDADRRLAERIHALADRRLVFFAGLPGTGKSLLVHQLVHLATGVGRRVHLLQWDVARPVFEASPAGRRYPLADGVTHAVIRSAAGRWSATRWSNGTSVTASPSIFWSARRRSSAIDSSSWHAGSTIGPRPC